MRPHSENSGRNAVLLPNRFGQLHEDVSIGLDLVAVAESHVLQFGRLKELVQGELPVAAAVAALGRECGLGHWLKGAGALYFSQLQSFSHLHEAHDEFHAHVTDVLDKVSAGGWSAAEQVRKSELTRTLHLLLLALIEFNHSVGK